MDSNTAPNDKSHSPIVAIDGTAIKRIRESKKLTQLYVASVVGVTTDTISRWENNRYPTIRRDNAEKLAAALEVEVDEILQRDVPATPDKVVETSLPVPSRSRFIGVVFILVICAAAFSALYLLRQANAPPTATRWLPRYGAPAEVIPVQIKVNRTGVKGEGFVVREKLPHGWLLVNSSPTAPTAQLPTDEIKWLVPEGSGTVTISYSVMIPRIAKTGSRSSISGSIVLASGVTSSTHSITGDSIVTIDGYHWADQNGDGRIDDNEIMPAYYLTEEMKGLGLDWKIVESIWSGRSYRWNPQTWAFDVER